MNIPSNFSPEEILRYCDVPRELAGVIEAQAAQVADLETELAAAQRELERVDEQAYFARELISDLDELIKSHTRFGEFVKAYRLARENSLFEV